MRAFVALLAALLLALFVVALVVFAVGNQANATYVMFGATFTVAEWIPVVVAAALGILLTVLALTPALSTAGKQRSLARERSALLERQLAEQSSANTTLQSRVATLERERDAAAQAQDQAQRERDDLAAKADRAEAAAVAAIQHGGVDQGMLANGVAPTTASPDARQTDAAPGAQRDATRAPANATATDERPFEVTRAEKPTLGDRLRTMFGPPEQPVEDPNATPDGTAPSA